MNNFIRIQVWAKLEVGSWLVEVSSEQASWACTPMEHAQYEFNQPAQECQTQHQITKSGIL